MVDCHPNETLSTEAEPRNIKIHGMLKQHKNDVIFLTFNNINFMIYIYYTNS